MTISQISSLGGVFAIDAPASASSRNIVLPDESATLVGTVNLITTDTAPDSETDFALIYDTSAAANRKTLLRNLFKMPVQFLGTGTKNVQTNENGILWVASAAGAVNLTLPQLSTVTDGFIVGFQINSGSGNANTLARSGTDTIVMGGVDVTNIVLPLFGDFIYLIGDSAAGRWRVLSDGIAGPYFQASLNAIQSAPSLGVYAKVAYANEISDSHGCYDPTTNYRFTPNIPGWYEVHAGAWMVATAAKRCGIALYKNGSVYYQGNRAYMSNDGKVTLSTMVFLNGSSDYIETYVIQSDTASGITDFDGAASAIMPNFTARRLK